MFPYQYVLHPKSTANVSHNNAIINREANLVVWFGSFGTLSPTNW